MSTSDFIPPLELLKGPPTGECTADSYIGGCDLWDRGIRPLVFHSSVYEQLWGDVNKYGLGSVVVDPNPEDYVRGWRCDDG